MGEVGIVFEEWMKVVGEIDFYIIKAYYFWKVLKCKELCGISKKCKELVGTEGIYITRNCKY